MKKLRLSPTIVGIVSGSIVLISLIILDDFKSYLDVIENYTDKVKTGYKYESDTAPITIGTGENVIRVYYVIDDSQTKELSYTVEYYKDGVKVEDDTQTVKQTVQVLESDITGLLKQHMAEYANFYDNEASQQILLSAHSNNKALLKPLKGIQYDSTILCTIIDDSDKDLVDLLDMKDRSWQAATETYLNTQRFYLIVDPKYVGDAIKAYNDVKATYKFYDYGIIDTEKVISNNYKANHNSLAEEIICKNDR